MTILFGLLFLTFSIFAGILIVYRILRAEGVMLFFFGSLVGIISTSWISYLLALFSKKIGVLSPISFSLFLVFFILTGLIFFFFGKIRHILPLFRDLKYRWLIGLIFLVFATALMILTFRYDNQNKMFLIDRFVWSDFAHHLPLIRSFSLGENVPPQAPLFAGEPIRYHFLFYFFTGLLERSGLPIDLALNIPSIIGFGGLLMAIWCLIEVLFRNERWIIGLGLIAIFLSITSSSLAFTNFSLPSPLTLTAFIGATLGATEFLSGGPYYNWDQTITNLFWNLNIFTNQRHFAFGIASALFIFAFLLITLQKKEVSPKKIVYQIVFLAVLMGLLPFFHGLTFISFFLIILFLLPFLPQKKFVLIFVILAGIIALPQFLSLHSGGPETYPIWFPGYAIHDNLQLDTFLEYWTKNLGLKFLLLPFLFIILPGLPRYILLASTGIFLLANLVRFGPDLYTNHKFFNIWLIFVNIAIAYLIIRLLMKRGVFWGMVAVFLVFLLTISGLLDIPPIFNTSHVQINDWQKDRIASFIVNKVRPNEVLATGYHVYHPATLTGRPIMLGWPYFAWSAGYPVKQRGNITRQLFETENPEVRCQIASKYNVRYLVAGKTPERTEPYHPDIVLLSNTLNTVAEDDRYIIFDLQPTCDLLKIQNIK